MIRTTPANLHHPPSTISLPPKRQSPNPSQRSARTARRRYDAIRSTIGLQALIPRDPPIAATRKT